MSHQSLREYLKSVCSDDGVSLVAIRRVEGQDVRCVRSAIGDVLEAIGASGMLAQWRQQRVLVKPNFCREGWRGETTSVRAIEGVIQILRDYACDILLADGMTQAYLPPRNPRGFGQVAARLSAVTKKYQIPFLHLDESREKRLRVEADGVVFYLPSCLAGMAGLVNLAALKVHPQMVGSFTVKNHMGLLSGPDRLELHRTGIAEGIWPLQACVAQVVPAQIQLVDGLLSFQGYDAPIASLEPGLVLGALNPCALDFACAQVMGIDPEYQFPQHSVAIRNNFAFGCGSNMRWDGPPLDRVRFQCHMAQQMTKPPPNLPSVRILWGVFDYPMNRAVKDLTRLIDRDLPLDIHVGGSAPTEDLPGRWSVLLGNASISAYHGALERVVAVPGNPPAGDVFHSVLEGVRAACSAAS